MTTSSVRSRKVCQCCCSRERKSCRNRAYGALLSHSSSSRSRDDRPQYKHQDLYMLNCRDVLSPEFQSRLWSWTVGRSIGLIFSGLKIGEFELSRPFSAKSVTAWCPKGVLYLSFAKISAKRRLCRYLRKKGRKDLCDTRYMGELGKCMPRHVAQNDSFELRPTSHGGSTHH